MKIKLTDVLRTMYNVSTMSDQDGISLYIISTNQVDKWWEWNSIFVCENYDLIQYQIPQTNIFNIVRLTVRRIINEVLGVKGL